MSDNLQKRFNSLKTSAGYDDLELVRWLNNEWLFHSQIAGPNAKQTGGRTLEKILHHCFSYYRIIGEWFHHCDELDQFVANTSDGMSTSKLIGVINSFYNHFDTFKPNQELTHKTLDEYAVFAWHRGNPAANRLFNEKASILKTKENAVNNYSPDLAEWVIKKSDSMLQDVQEIIDRGIIPNGQKNDLPKPVNRYSYEFIKEQELQKNRQVWKDFGYPDWETATAEVLSSRYFNRRSESYYQVLRAEYENIVGTGGEPTNYFLQNWINTLPSLLKKEIIRKTLKAEGIWHKFTE